MNSLISYIVVAIHARESRSPVKVTTPMMKIKMNVSMDVLRFIPIVLLSRLDRSSSSILAGWGRKPPMTSPEVQVNNNWPPAARMSDPY